ncbi:unnamed protein product [Didymodactylos carnosus]|uniref:FAD dependent oxidoreductase domain-containing protein n=1 Tax=Didymodactylos carnosus TaxID=1234261 RepID=A0A8S2E3F0_9BILA|nr:unnamed protein product [Didymodactylos carnosus]CAF3822502.1 unnamed protein product [Didymodactylos carnosus]
MLHNKATELIPTFSQSEYKYIGSYTGIRPATEYSDYQIHSYNDLQWICCGGIRSTGLTSSLAIGEYVNNKLNEMMFIKHQLLCTGYSLEQYSLSLKQLKSMFKLTPIGLQPNVVAGKQKLVTTSTGNIHVDDNITTSNVRIDCDGQFYDISHSLLKLAWSTRQSSLISAKL